MHSTDILSDHREKGVVEKEISKVSSSLLQLPPQLKEQHFYVNCKLQGPTNVSSYNYNDTYSSLGIRNFFSLKEFKKSFQIIISHYESDHVIFDAINIDVALANAIRRILLAEIPTVAIETVHIFQNSGVMQDEILAHRLGLIPFKINPDLISVRKDHEDLKEGNSVKFRLHVRCTERMLSASEQSLPVYSKHLQWIPWSDNEENTFRDFIPEAVEPNILITKLRPGQEIELECYHEKGIGKTHTKWSAVATACYRLVPILTFPKGALSGEEAKELKELCPMSVFDIEDDISVVKNPRKCTTCRACLERFPDRVKLLKDKQHFIFSIESVGIIPAPELFIRAVQVLKDKVDRIRRNLFVVVHDLQK